VSQHHNSADWPAKAFNEIVSAQQGTPRNKTIDATSDAPAARKGKLPGRRRRRIPGDIPKSKTPGCEPGVL
jgi:hypothetical protein